MDATASNCLHSFVWDSEDYYLKSHNFIPTAIVGSNKKSFVFVNTNTSVISASMTLCSLWGSSNTNRSFMIRVTALGKLQYTQSSDGSTTDIDITTNSAMGLGWQSVIVTVDPTLSGATNVVKIYFDNVAQSCTAATDTGTNTTNTTSVNKLTLGCFFGAADVPNSYYSGFINQFVVTSDIISPTEVTNFYNGGLYQNAHTYFDNIVIGANFDQADFAGRYIVQDITGNGNDFIQASTNTAGGREIHWCHFLNPKGLDGYSFTDTLANGNNFFSYTQGLGTSTSYNNPGLKFTINHTATVDQDRNSHEVVTKCAYDLTQGDLYVGFVYDYATVASGLPHSHGGSSVHDLRNDTTEAFWTHRSLVNSNDTFRILIADALASQVDNETTVPKGSKVYYKMHWDGTNCIVSFWWFSSGVFTQVWTDQTLLSVRHVRPKFHARDYNAYANPNNFTFTNLSISRTIPTS